MAESTHDEREKKKSVTAEEEANEALDPAASSEAGSGKPPKPERESKSESEPDSEPEAKGEPEPKPKRKFKPLDKKLPEHPEGLAKRSEWFRKRRGDSS